MTEMIEAEPYLTLEVLVGQMQDLGAVDGVGRRFIPIVGGTVSGALNGAVLPGGADWQTVTPGGLLQIDARYLLDCDGARVEVDSNGVRDAAPDVMARIMRGEPVSGDEYYFRTFVRMTSSDPRHAVLNKRLFVARGERLSDRVRLTVHMIP